MLNLITLLVIGSVLAYVSQYNLELISLRLGQYTISDIPLFYVIIGSLLLGLVLSYLLQLLRNISHSIKLSGTKKEVRTGQAEVLALTKRIHQLELENEKLKHVSAEPLDHNAL